MCGTGRFTGALVGDNGQIIRIIGRSYDVSSDRRIQEELSEEAKRDPLTRLYNKVAASGEVERILKSERKNSMCCS